MISLNSDGSVAVCLHDLVFVYPADWLGRGKEVVVCRLCGLAWAADATPTCGQPRSLS